MCKNNHVKNKEVDINKDILLSSEQYPSIYIDENKSCVIRELKTRFKTISFYESHNLKTIRLYIDNKQHNKYYHLLLGEFKKIDFNHVVFLDGNTLNITSKNLKYETINLDSFKPIPFYTNLYINSDGTIYDNVLKISYTHTKINNNIYYCFNHRVDFLVYTLFKENILNSKGEIIHIDGNTFNNKINNLLFKYNDINEHLIIEDNDKNKVFTLKSLSGKKFYLCKLSDKNTCDKLYSTLKEKIKENRYIEQWINSFIKTDLPFYQNLNEKRNNEKKRTKSSGCYWWKPRKKWKSKIFYNNKEYSLGYYDSFEEGKIIYETACIFIKYDKFEKWFDNIKNQQKIINTIYKE
jgi:hypothetical protein